MRLTRKAEIAQGIEGAFERTWKFEEEHFRRHPASEFAILFHAFRKNGYDRALSLQTVKRRYSEGGPSVHGLILGRTLRPRSSNHPHLWFSSGQDIPLRVVFRGPDVNVRLNLERLEITKDIEHLLVALLAYPIDYLSFLDGDQNYRE